MTKSKLQQESAPTIRRARYDSLSLYEVTEDELNSLEKGPTESVFLCFAVFTFTTAISFLIALTNTTITNIKTYNTFLVIMVLGFLSGTILIILWFLERRSSKSVCQKIRARMNDEKEKLDIASQTEDPTSTLGITFKDGKSPFKIDLS